MNIQVSYYASQRAKMAIVCTLTVFLICFIGNVYFFTTKPNIFIFGTLMVALGLVTVGTFAFYAIILQNQPLISFTLNHVTVTTGILFKEKKVVFKSVHAFTLSKWGRSYIEYKERADLQKVPFYAVFLGKDSMQSIVENMDDFQSMYDFIPDIQL